MEPGTRTREAHFAAAGLVGAMLLYAVDKTQGDLEWEAVLNDLYTDDEYEDGERSALLIEALADYAAHAVRRGFGDRAYEFAQAQTWHQAGKLAEAGIAPKQRASP